MVAERGSLIPQWCSQPLASCPSSKGIAPIHALVSDLIKCSSHKKQTSKRKGTVEEGMIQIYTMKL